MASTAGCSGEIAISTTARCGPSIAGERFWFSAPKGNPGRIYIGFNEDGAITVPDGDDGITCGIELQKGVLWGPIPVANLNLLDFIGSADGCSVLYFGVR